MSEIKLCSISHSGAWYTQNCLNPPAGRQGLQLAACSLKPFSGDVHDLRDSEFDTASAILKLPNCGFLINKVFRQATKPEAR
jgi:hypothetical protein